MSIPTRANAVSASLSGSAKQRAEAENALIRIDGEILTKGEVMKTSGVARQRLNMLIRTGRLTWAAIGVVR